MILCRLCVVAGTEPYITRARMTTWTCQYFDTGSSSHGGSSAHDLQQTLLERGLILLSVLVQY